MAFTQHTIDAEHFLFSTFDDLQWLEQRIELQHSDLGWQKVSIEMITNADGWVALKEHKLFNYSPDICGPIFGGGFNPSKPYIITVELHSEQLTWLSLSLGDLPIADWFSTPEMMTVLSDPQKFLLISTMQPITPKTKWGMSTTFSQSHHQ